MIPIYSIYTLNTIYILLNPVLGVYKEVVILWTFLLKYHVGSYINRCIDSIKNMQDTAHGQVLTAPLMHPPFWKIVSYLIIVCKPIENRLASLACYNGLTRKPGRPSSFFYNNIPIFIWPTSLQYLRCTVIYINVIRWWWTDENQPIVGIFVKILRRINKKFFHFVRKLFSLKNTWIFFIQN